MIKLLSKDCYAFLKRITFEWAARVTKVALVTLQARRFNAEWSLPEPSDLDTEAAVSYQSRNSET